MPLQPVVSKRLVQTVLPYKPNALAPVLSETNIDYHYGHLYKGYVDRYNNHEGSREFNKAGAFLHDIFFTQFTKPNTPRPGPVFMELIGRWQRFDVFKDEMLERAMAIQGSGWIYLSSEAAIKTIPNHQIRHDIVLLIDWWEHAWNPDYLWDKQRYFDNIWRIIDWDHIDARIAGL